MAKEKRLGNNSKHYTRIVAVLSDGRPSLQQKRIFIS